MAVTIPHDLIEYMLLGPPDDRRQLQDSPILGGVWITFATVPDQAIDLLITPYKDMTASTVALALEGRLVRTSRKTPTSRFSRGSSPRASISMRSCGRWCR